MVLEWIAFEVAYEELGSKCGIDDESEELEDDADQGYGTTLRVS